MRTARAVTSLKRTCIHVLLTCAKTAKSAPSAPFASAIVRHSRLAQLLVYCASQTSWPEVCRQALDKIWIWFLERARSILVRNGPRSSQLLHAPSIFAFVILAQPLPASRKPCKADMYTCELLPGNKRAICVEHVRRLRDAVFCKRVLEIPRACPQATHAQGVAPCSSHAPWDQVSPNITDWKAGSGMSRYSTFVQLQCT